MIARIWHVIVKEFIQFRRDRLLVGFLVVFPVMQLVMIARATAGDPVDLPLAFLDQDKSALSRSLGQVLDGTEALALAYSPSGMDQVRSLLDGGKASVAVVIPPGFAADLLSANQAPQIQVIADGSNVFAASTVLGAAEGAINTRLARWVADNSASAALSVPAVDVQTAIRFNPALNAQFNAVPGLLAFVVYQVTMVVSAVSLVRERELGTLEQLVVTPVRRGELWLGKALPAVLIGLANFAVLVTVVVAVLEIPMRGSWMLLFGLAALFIATETGVGLTISSVAHTQQQALLIVFPLAMIDQALSGNIVPVESMPPAMQTLSLFSPLRHYMHIQKSIMVKGADLSTLWPDALALVALLVVVALLSLRNLGRTIE